MVLLNAPIVPWEGMGGVKLYSHIREFYDILIISMMLMLY